MFQNKKLPHFSEKEIRPDNFRNEISKVIRADIRRMISKKKNFLTVNCPACGSKKYQKKYSKYSMVFVECERCKTFFTNPRPTPKILSWFYKNSLNYDYWNKYIFSASEQVRKNKIVIPRVDRILSLCKELGSKTNSILEVGAGHGTFCQEIMSRRIFKKVIAVEPADVQAKTCRNKGIRTINSTIERVKFKKKQFFDIVVSFEVIEHLFSPKEFVINCKKILKKGGLFIITCPNGKGFDFEVLGKKCNSIDHEHLNYFNPYSILLLFKDAGFEVLEVSTPGRLDAELVRKKILSGGYDISRQPFLKQVLIDKWDEVGERFQDFLANNCLSSSLWVVAKKI